ncbi:Fic family protein [Candidatus Woesearchaeota archaeon]|nr:Fic family protein [Candidatus Woesearchaeota archaeon]
MNLVKRKNYYYLSYSFRSKGRVIHRERYIGKEIPENIEAIKEKFLRECMREDLFKKLNKIKKNFQKEWVHYPDSIKKEILIDFSIEFTYNTNAIEGSTLTLEETEYIIKRKISPNKPLRDVQETINHSKVFFDMLNEKEELSYKKLLQWHKEIFCDTKLDIAGKIRDYLVKIGDYIAPDWQDLDKLIRGFFKWHADNKKTINAVEFAARAHYKFEKIHPFGDGNGRIGRLIIAYILRKSNYPILIIEYKKRKQYYHALNKDENYFVNYFIRRYLKAHKKYLN